MTINLGEFVPGSEKALIGRNLGEATKNTIEEAHGSLEDLERRETQILILVPDEIITLNRSFFLGLFETAVQRLGNRGFEYKYRFDAPIQVRRRIQQHIEYALLVASQDEILHA